MNSGGGGGGSSSSKSRYAYHSHWQKGYTLAPPNPEGNGDYTYLDNEGKEITSEEFSTIRDHGADKVKTEPGVKLEPAEPGEIVDPARAAALALQESQPDPKPAEDIKKEAGDSGEGDAVSTRPISEITKNRNPILWCNEQSKIRHMMIQWEQVAEHGMPHDKTFVWRMTMGELIAEGVASTKKGAKNAAAENMARKLDAMPCARKKRPPQQQQQYNQGFQQPRGPGPGGPMVRNPFGFGGPRRGMAPRGPIGFQGGFPPGPYGPFRNPFAPGGGGPHMSPMFEDPFNNGPMMGPMGMGMGPMPPWMMGPQQGPPNRQWFGGRGGYGGGGPRKRPPPTQQSAAKTSDSNKGSETANSASSSAAAAPQPPPPKAAKYLNPAQDNPISKLYEYCKQRRTAEPIFETVMENVLEQRKTAQGHTFKKVEYTVQCSYLGKQYTGTALIKKEAKKRAAERAWADLLESQS